MKHLLYSICIIMAGIFLSSCRSSKSASKEKISIGQGSTSTTPIHSNKDGASSTTASKAETAAFVKKISPQRTDKQCLTASAKVRITGVGAKDLSVNGQLRMRRNDVVRLSLRFLGMEVGLLEFTPKDVLVVDRVNKQYVRASYSEVSFLRQAALDFYSLQSLFWNEIFIPGSSEGRIVNASDIEMTHEHNLCVLTPKDTPKHTYHFYADPAQQTLNRLQVVSSNKADKGQFAWNYDSFERFQGRPFPTSMQMCVSGTTKDVTLSLNLSGLKTDANWNYRTTISSKYTRRSVQEVLGKLF